MILKDQNHLVQLRSLVQENVLDVFAVSESWLNSSVKNTEVEIQDKISRLDRRKKISGGVCINTRKKKKVLKDLTSDTLGFWQLWLQVQHKNLKSILICAALSTTILRLCLLEWKYLFLVI